MSGAAENQAEVSFIPLDVNDAGNVFALQCMAHRDALHEPETLFSRILTAQGAISLGLRVDGKFSGYALGYPVKRARDNFQDGPRPERDAGVLYLHDLALLPRVQGSGYGAALYLAFEKEAMRLGFNHIIANAIDGQQDFWARRGYSPVSETSYHGVQAMRMEKTLDMAGTGVQHAASENDPSCEGFARFEADESDEHL